MRSAIKLQNFDGSSQKAITWYGKIGKFIFFLPQHTLNIIVCFAYCTQLTPFKTIWFDFCIMYPSYSFQDHLTKFIIVYTTDSFQDHVPWFLYCVPKLLL